MVLENPSFVFPCSPDGDVDHGSGQVVDPNHPKHGVDSAATTFQRRKNFVPILYRELAFEAYDDPENLLESIRCETSKKPVKFVVRIHAGIDRDWIGSVGCSASILPVVIDVPVVARF
jgi:hypothetical protein